MIDKKQAMKLATQWEDASQQRITEAQARRVLSDIHEQIHGSRLATPSLTDYVTQWLKRKEGETAAVTLKTYQHAVEEFRDFMEMRAAQPIHFVTPSQVAAWRDAAAAKATARTANNKLKIIRTLFQSAWRDGLLTENPAAKVSSLKSAEGNRRPFTLGELKALLGFASSEWRGMILAGFYTGQRLKDVASLTWQNVDMVHGEIRLATSKTARRQILPIAKPLRAYLEQLPASDDPAAPLFPNSFLIATQSRDTSRLSQQFHDLLVSASLSVARPKKHKPEGKGRSARRKQNEVTFHSLRHTATSLLKRAGVGEAVARDIIGHDSAEMSSHYTHVDEEQKREAIAKLPDLTT